MKELFKEINSWVISESAERLFIKRREFDGDFVQGAASVAQFSRPNLQNMPLREKTIDPDHSSVWKHQHVFASQPFSPYPKFP